MSDKKRILVVEDEPSLLRVTTFWLNRDGYEVLSANNGVKGLEMARTNLPDLIILDLNMPLMDGGAVCGALKADEKLRKIPVIVLSASVNDLDTKAKEIGADGWMLKPYQPEQFLSKVKNLI